MIKIEVMNLKDKVFMGLEDWGKLLQIFEVRLKGIHAYPHPNLTEPTDACFDQDTFAIIANKLKDEVEFVKLFQTKQSTNWTIADGIERTDRILGMKAEEYATESDRYWNFRRIKELAEAYYPHIKVYNLPLSFYATILQLKHTVSVLDIEYNLYKGKFVLNPLLDEKFGDETNYNFLIEGLIREENEAARNKHNARTTESE